MNCPLAIFAPDPIGLGVSTFIRRHIRDLLPGRTALMAPASMPGSAPPEWKDYGEGEWKVDGPVLDLDLIVGGRFRWQVARAATRALGVKLDHLLIKRFLKLHHVRVIMGEYLDFSLQWLDVARDLGIPFFAHAHGHDAMLRPYEPEWRARYLRYNQVAGIIAMSHAGRLDLLAGGLLPSKVHVVHYGVDVPQQPVARPERDQIRCIAVARVVPEKAPILLLDAFRRAAEACPRLRLDFLGAGPLFPAVEQFVRAFHLESRVTLHGSLPHARTLEVMKGADIFLQHSLREGLGVSILEAMALALPVVSTLTGGIPESVVEGSTGYLVEPGDSEAMGDRIAALARDPGQRRALGLAGWQRVKDCFTWERERADLLRLLGLEKYQ